MQKDWQCLFSICTETEISQWQNCRYCLHRKLLKWQLPVQAFANISTNNDISVPVNVKPRPPGEFWRKKRFIKRLIFTEKRLKNVFQSQDLAIKICRQMQRYSLWSGLDTWRQGFSQRFVFLGFFFLLENFCVGHDGANWCDAPWRAVGGGCGRAPYATGGGSGVLPREIFC